MVNLRPSPCKKPNIFENQFSKALFDIQNAIRFESNNPQECNV